MKAICCLLVMMNVSMRNTVTPCDAQCQQVSEREHGADGETSKPRVQKTENTGNESQAGAEPLDDVVTGSTSSPHRNATKSDNRSLCDGRSVTSVYERGHDIDMKYVQDSITALWRIIFCLIFTLVSVVFLVSYVTSLIRRNGETKYSPAVNKYPNRADFPMDRGSQLYFPVINATRTANFLKDLDPIYDYPCSLQSDYEKV